MGEGGESHLAFEERGFANFREDLTACLPSLPMDVKRILRLSLPQAGENVTTDSVDY